MRWLWQPYKALCRPKKERRPQAWQRPQGGLQPERCHQALKDHSLATLKPVYNLHGYQNASHPRFSISRVAYELWTSMCLWSPLAIHGTSQDNQPTTASIVASSWKSLQLHSVLCRHRCIFCHVSTRNLQWWFGIRIAASSAPCGWSRNLRDTCRSLQKWRC